MYMIIYIYIYGEWSNMGTPQIKDKQSNSNLNYSWETLEEWLFKTAGSFRWVSWWTWQAEFSLASSGGKGSIEAGSFGACLLSSANISAICAAGACCLFPTSGSGCGIDLVKCIKPAHSAGSAPNCCRISCWSELRLPTDPTCQSNSSCTARCRTSFRVFLAWSSLVEMMRWHSEPASEAAAAMPQYAAKCEHSLMSLSARSSSLKAEPELSATSREACK